MVTRLVFLSVSTIGTVKCCTKLSIFKFLFLFHFVTISYSLSSHPFPSRTLFLILLHNGVKKHSREKPLICDLVSERRILLYKVLAKMLRLLEYSLRGIVKLNIIQNERLINF